MLKHPTLSILLFFFLSIFTTFSCDTLAKKKVLDKTSNIVDGLTNVQLKKKVNTVPTKKKYIPSKYNLYVYDWCEIDSLNEEILPKSALEKVESIYQRAVKEDNYPQVIKSIIFKSNYIAQLEEEGMVRSIELWREEIKHAKAPTKQILQSILAQVADNYLKQNYWKNQNRTETTEADKPDILTWSTERLNRYCSELYLASLENEDLLKKETLNDFRDITTKGNTELIRPTLYDFLAHRAIDYFMNERHYLTQAAYKFELRDSLFFGSTEEFLNTTMVTEDMDSRKKKTLELFKDLLRHKIEISDCNGLADIELKRLAFVKNNSVLEAKNEHYLKALNRLYENYEGDDTAAEILYQIANWYYFKGRYYHTKIQEAKKCYPIALSYAEKAAEEYPNTFGASLANQLIRTLKTKYIRLYIEKVNLPNQPILVKINYRNTKKVFVKVVNWSEEKEAQLYLITKNILHEDSIRMKIGNYLNSLPSSQKGMYELEGTEDFRDHSTEIYFKGLPLGQYLMITGTDEDFSLKNNQIAYTKTIISELGFWSEEVQVHDKNKFFTVYNRRTGAPMSDVKVEFYEPNFYVKNKDRSYAQASYVKEDLFRQKMSETISDKNGFFYSNYPLDKRGHKQKYCVKLSRGKDTLFLYDRYDTFKDDRNGSNGLSTGYRINFFTDRAIYRPGQTVHFKGLLLDYYNSNAPTIGVNKQVTVQFKDVNRQKISELVLHSNEYGTINGTFTAPQGSLLGSMSINSSDTYKGTKQIRVEEYKRPKFSVKFEPIQESYAINDSIFMEGNAFAFAGNPIDGAKVSYSVSRSNWAYSPWYNFHLGYNNRAQTQLNKGELITDKNGKFIVPFKAIPNEKLGERALLFYTVTVSVTDITGETHTHSSVVRVGKVTLQVKTDIPDQIEAKDFKTIVLETKNLNNEYEAAKGTLELQLLNKPRGTFVNRPWIAAEFTSISEKKFKTLFPYLHYKSGDNPKDWSVKKTIYKANFDTENSSNLKVRGINFPTGKYKAVLKTEDRNGNAIEVEKIVTIINLNTGKIPVNEVGWHYTKNQTYQPGETAKLFFGTNDKNLNVLFTVVRRGKKTSRKWLKIRDLEAELLKVGEKDRGNFFYFFNYAKHNRSFNSVDNQGIVKVPWTNKELQIEYATFRDKLLPGEEDEWQIKIRGSKGEKVVAEMLATMYDASLDAFTKNSFSETLYWTNKGSNSRMTSKNSGYGGSSSKSIEHEWQEKIEGLDKHKIYHKLNLFGFGIYGQREFAPDRLVKRAREEYYSNWRIANPYSNRLHQQKWSAFDFVHNLNPSIATFISYVTADSHSDISMNVVGSISSTYDYSAGKSSKQKAKVKQALTVDSQTPQIRENLDETVFFYPNLMTDKEGNIVFKFKMNEALTSWKFLGLVTTKDLKYGITEKEIITQKELMVVPNAPRFFREKDKIEFTAKVVNMSKKDLTGTANFKLTNPINGEPIFECVNFEKDFIVKAGQSTRLAWYLEIPEVSEVPLIQHTVSAKAGNFSDAERSITPVLTNRMLVTETMPMPIAGGASKSFIFKSMQENSASKTLTHESLTLEFTSNPAWYAVKVLPSLMNLPNASTDGILSAYYANALASSVANKYPIIKATFAKWKEEDKDALLSNLSKNQELKTALLKETPWILDAQREKVKKWNIGLLFDLNKMSYRQKNALRKLQERQNSDGGFSWFPDGDSDWYTTQYVLETMGHLDKLGVTDIAHNRNTRSMIQSAIRYCDNQVFKYYNDIKFQVINSKTTWQKNHLTPLVIHYLYARTFYLKNLNFAANNRKSNIQSNKRFTEFEPEKRLIFEFFLGQTEDYFLRQNTYHQGMIALALERMGKTDVPNKIVKSLRESALYSEELGMYFKTETGYNWYELPIECHSLLIEVMQDVALDEKAVEKMKIWLLKHKQTNNWRTSKATASAVYSLLSSGDNWLLETEPVKMTFANANTKYNTQVSKAQQGAEAGTGYFKTRIKGADINKSMTTININNPNKNIAWGAAYWQYFEDLDRITSFKDTPLKIKKQLFKVTRSDTGEKLISIKDGAKLSPGDEIRVQIELRVDRRMEYIHMKDGRSAGFEPVNVISRYKRQAGLRYYESTHDASTDFFFSRLPKGTHVFEYPVRVVHNGNFSNGITTVQCMYAPEFTSHSEGVRVEVE